MTQKVVIVGGGAAGISVASRLLHSPLKPEVTIIEPSERHYYQPLWTLVGAGVATKESTEREEVGLIPSGVKWVKDYVEGFLPEENQVLTRGGQRIDYDFLVVAAGIQLNWHKVKGLKEAIGRDGVCSNYSYKYVDYTWENIKNFKGGDAVFTHPSGAVKCGGAPQKICYLADDYFRKSGVREKSRITFAAAMPNIFAVEKYAKTLDKVIARKGIETHFKVNLTELRTESRQAIFQHLESKEELVLHYDMIHVTPPMGSPDFIAQSSLADQDGWVEVDKFKLQHVRYKNVFSLGDCSSLPTSKTGAAVRKQAPVVAANLLALMQGQALSATYDGYTSCPLVTGYGKLVLAEFDYDKNPKETFPFDQSKERWSMYMLKRYGLPWLYWHRMLKGKM